jgi:hypothetical protein
MRDNEHEESLHHNESDLELLSVLMKLQYEASRAQQRNGWQITVDVFDFVIFKNTVNFLDHCMKVLRKESGW